MTDHVRRNPASDAPDVEHAHVNDDGAQSGLGEAGNGVEAKSDWRKLLASWGWLGRRIFNAALVIAVGLGVLWSMGFAMRQGWFPAQLGGQDSRGASAGDVKRYICPMMCVPPTTEPGRCPVCGMELVEAAASGAGDGVSITIEPAHRRLIGVRTAVAQLEAVHRTIRTIGSIQYDESRLSTISAYVDGRLEQLFADYVGVPVNEGDDLALIYSPELYTAQAEFLAAQDQTASSRFVDSSRLSELAAEKLYELGMSADQVNTLRQEKRPQSRIRLRSPQKGTVIEKRAVEGDYVKTGQSIYRVADLSTVWMMLDLFPDDAARVRFGQQVEAQVSSAPGVVFKGRVAFIDPTVDPKTRSVSIRVELRNTDGRLRPGDYATARVLVSAIPRELVYDPELAGKFISPMHPQVIRDTPGTCPICDMELVPATQLGFSSEPLPEQRVVTIPRDAVLMAGNNSVVYVEVEPGRFEVRRVTLGVLTDREAVIVEGLKAGEKVATQGNFLLDSQSQLAGNPSLLDPSGAPKFAPGPLPFESDSQPVLLTAASAAGLDQAYRAYIDVQSALANDSKVPPTVVSSLKAGLEQSLATGALPDGAQRALQTARDTAERLVAPIDDARVAFRTVSHAMIQSLQTVRSEETQNGLRHFYCPMVPGGGGDWLQADAQLKNPYWGAEMLTCGEMVRDLSLSPQPNPAVEEDPFAELEVQSLDLGN